MTDDATSPTRVVEHRSLLKAALLLQRLGSHPRAVESLQKLLTIDPYNVDALRAIARSWQATGEHGLAREALERVRKTVPDDMGICVEIAEIYTKNDDHESAYKYIKSALEIDPNSAVAHQAMVKTLEHLGRPVEALSHRQRRSGLVPSVLAPAMLETLDEPIRVLVIAGGETSHPTIARALRRHDFAMQVLHIETLSSNVLLPAHDVLFSTLRFDARYRSTLQHLEELMVLKEQPVINRPASVLATDPAILAWRLAHVEGLQVAPVARIERELLLSEACGAELQTRGLSFPLIFRAGGAHARREHSASLEDLQSFVARDDAPYYECSPFLDLRSGDGRVRCYRIALIDNRLYPLAFASAYHWRVDLATNDAPPESTEDEEDEFFFDAGRVLGEANCATLRFIAQCIEIDMCVVDVSMSDEGKLTLLHVDASSDWADPPDGEAFATRRRASDRARSAIFSLILDRVEKKKIESP